MMKNNNETPNPIKTFVITVSKNFPATHKRKGEPTFFPDKILNQLLAGILVDDVDKKKHTIRANYPFWKKRIEQVQAGEAILSIRYWSGKPYNSKQVEICKLGKDDGVGVQMFEFSHGFQRRPVIESFMSFDLSFDDLAKNDGLSREDFEDWFKGYDLTEPMAIIHFTTFRY